MILKIGNIWNELGRADLILITTNNVVKDNNALVMGAGIAKQAADKFPDLPYYYGPYIKNHLKYGTLLGYQSSYKTEIGLFQTKYHFKDKSDLNLIDYSIDCLKYFESEYKRIALACPGIGLGGLSPEDVIPILHKLNDHVLVYTLENIL